jgi:predicted phosphodiesterase
MLEACGKVLEALVKILIISDTHTDSINNLPRLVLDELSGADMIIHAGGLPANASWTRFVR